MQPFKGYFQQLKFDSQTTPHQVLTNHKSCKVFSDFITNTILQRIGTGALQIWGKVSEVDPPWLVLPLLVEPGKPRLCIDARFLNLWMKDSPFTLDTLTSVPAMVYEHAHMSKIDDKSGYDHVFISRDSRQYFGIQWNGWWFVCTVLPFGWKNSPYIYQTLGMVSTNYFRELGITCLLYIDDRLTGEIFHYTGRWSRVPALRSQTFSYEAANSALFVVCRLLIGLGYFIGLRKCVLEPTPTIIFLGMGIHSNTQSFSIPPEKREKFAQLREMILDHSARVPLKSLQKLMGKCISFSLAFPGAKYYIREMAAAIGRASRGGKIILGPALKAEIEFWRFLDTWTQHIPWRKESHVALTLSTDASAFRWAATIHFASGDIQIGDYWQEDLRNEHINVKEMCAVANAIEALPAVVQDERVDVQVDSLVTLHAWEGKGPKSIKLSKMAQRLFHIVTKRNITLSLSYVPSDANPADYFSRKLSPSDSMLSPLAWDIVQKAYGGHGGHNLDLMALDSNVQRDREGTPLKHFTPYPTPQSSGVNVFNQDLARCEGSVVNAYAFPPFSLIGPLIRFIIANRAVVTLVVPKLSPVPVWWPVINAQSSSRVLVAPKGHKAALLLPTKHGFQLRPLAFELWAFRVGDRQD